MPLLLYTQVHRSVNRQQLDLGLGNTAPALFTWKGRLPCSRQQRCFIYLMHTGLRVSISHWTAQSRNVLLCVLA
jgi:hypothetical protein